MVKSNNLLAIKYKPFSSPNKQMKNRNKLGNIKISLDNVIIAQSFTDILCSNRKKIIDGEQMYVFNKNDLNNLKAIWCLKFLQENDEDKYKIMKEKLFNENKSNDISQLITKLESIRLV
jgi:hypothetical protein